MIELLAARRVFLIVSLRSNLLIFLIPFFAPACYARLGTCCAPAGILSWYTAPTYRAAGGLLRYTCATVCHYSSPPVEPGRRIDGALSPLAAWRSPWSAEPLAVFSGTPLARTRCAGSGRALPTAAVDVRHASGFDGNRAAGFFLQHPGSELRIASTCISKVVGLSIRKHQ